MQTQKSIEQVTFQPTLQATTHLNTSRVIQYRLGLLRLRYQQSAILNAQMLISFPRLRLSSGEYLSQVLSQEVHLNVSQFQTANTPQHSRVALKCAKLAKTQIEPVRTVNCVKMDLSALNKASHVGRAQSILIQMTKEQHVSLTISLLTSPTTCTA